MKCKIILRNTYDKVSKNISNDLFFFNLRSNHRRYSVRKGVLRNFAKFTGKHLCQIPFFNKAAGQAWNFIKKGTLVQVFSCEFCEISDNTFLTEHLWTTASET